jgi:nucleotide-binding universal stress UspA family protein
MHRRHGPSALFAGAERSDDEGMKRIVVGVDGSKNAADALRWGVAIAERRGWSVSALLAWDTLEQHHPDRVRRFASDYGQADAEAALDAYVTDAVGPDRAGLVAKEAVVGSPAPLLIDASAEAEMLVLGPRGSGAALTAVLGSVSLYCTQWARCPVAIVHDLEHEGQTSPRRIVVGVDGSGPSRQALEWAVEEARASAAQVDVVHAWHPPYAGAQPYTLTMVASEDLERAARQVLDRTIEGVDTRGLARPVEPILVQGGASQWLLETAKGADLVVVGSRGRGGFSGLLLGSVSQQLMHHADCPVVVVPHSDRDDE